MATDWLSDGDLINWLIDSPAQSLTKLIQGKLNPLSAVKVALTQGERSLSQRWRSALEELQFISGVHAYYNPADQWIYEQFNNTTCSTEGIWDCLITDCYNSHGFIFVKPDVYSSNIKNKSYKT